jgi:hypothetical protein
MAENSSALLPTVVVQASDFFYPLAFECKPIVTDTLLISRWLKNSSALVVQASDFFYPLAFECKPMAVPKVGRAEYIT